MNQNATKQLNDLIDIIQLKTQKTQAEIAKSVGRSPARLSIALNGKIDAEPWIVKLKAIYNDVLPQEMPQMAVDTLIKENLAYSKVILGAVAELLAKDGQLPIASVIEKLNRAIAEERKHLG